MNLPIIIIHKGAGFTFYLKSVIRQIRLFNPGNKIYLLSDSSTANYKDVEHYDITKWDDFRDIYKHMSAQPYEYQLFCFQRWFIIRNFVKEKNFTKFLCLDSDVLLYCSVDDIFQQYEKYNLAICENGMPCYTYFKIETINKFCDYITSLYTNKESLNRLRKEIYEKNKFGGVSDMSIFVLYKKEIDNNVMILDKPKNNCCFDTNLQISDGYEMENRVKKIYWKNNLPYGKLIENGEMIRFYALHLQGGCKHNMHKYFLDKEKKHYISLYETFKWKYNYKHIKSRFYEIQNMFSSRKMFIHMLKRKIRL